MTYFGFLLRFLVVPLLLLGVVILFESRRPGSKRLPARDWRSWLAVLVHVVIAVLYTTPWDNYLVATGVWWYDPNLVTGITLGWVPLEEYTFFVLQTLLAGLWVLFLAGHVAPARRSETPLASGIRIVATSATMVVWVGAVMILFAGWRPGTYLALELAWALPPIALQLAFGADILWQYRRLVGLAIVPLTLYLSLGDALAIGSGTWTINGVGASALSRQTSKAGASLEPPEQGSMEEGLWELPVLEPIDEGSPDEELLLPILDPH